MKLILPLFLACSTLQGSVPAPAPAPPGSGARISLSVPDKGSASALQLASTLLPGEVLELVTAEAILERTRGDFGIFGIKPAKSDWKTDAAGCSYQWRTPEGLVLDFSAKPEGDMLLLEYVLENGTGAKLERLLVHPCLPTQGAPSFFPGTPEQARLGSGGRSARAGKNDYSELWSRLYLWSEGKRFSFADSAKAKEEQHLAFMRTGAEAIEWSWWKNGERTFDLPLIAAESKDGKHVLALGFEKALWASSNSGDPRACMHLFPSFGKLAKGAKAKVRGRLYLSEGNAETARARFLADFPRSDKP